LFHVKTKHFYRILITIILRKSNFLLQSTGNLISYQASRNVSSVKKIFLSLLREGMRILQELFKWNSMFCSVL